MRDDELLRRYLLGGLSGDDKDRLESRLIRERSLFEIAEAIEDEILDDYSQGLLDSAERIRVQRRLLATPEGRSRLALIRGLGKLAAEQEQGKTAKILPWREKSLSRPQQRFAAIAAMLLIGMGSAYLYRQRVSPAPGGPVPPPVVAESPQPTAPVATPTPITPAPQPPDRVAEREVTPVPPPSPASLVLELALGTVLRGEEGLDRLEVPAGTETIELRLLLASGDAGYSSYEASLIDTALGSEVLHAQGLAVREIGDDSVLILHLKGSQLQEGTYAVQVQGVIADGEVVDLADHEFGVQTKVK